MFTALYRDDFIFSADTLDAVLAFVAECNEPQFGEDSVVWQGGRVAAVCRSDGRVIRLDALAVPSAA